MNEGSPNRPSLILDIERRVLLRDGERLELTPRVCNALRVLVEHAPETVTFARFLAAWGANVEDHAITGAISDLREALGELGGYIITRRGIGYRLDSDHLKIELKSPNTSLDRSPHLGRIAYRQTEVVSGRWFQSSIRNANEALVRGPDEEAYLSLVRSYLNLAYTGFYLKRPDEVLGKARQAIHDALSHFPKSAAAHAWKGLLALISDHDWNAAASDFDTALELDPNNAQAHNFLAHWHVSRRQFGIGLEHSQQAAQLAPDFAPFVMTEPWLLMFAGRFDDALAKGEDAVKKFSGVAPVHDLMGHIYQAAGRDGEAIDEYNAAWDIEFLPGAIASLGYVYGKIDDAAAAEKCLTTLQVAAQSGKIALMPGYCEALIFAGLKRKEECLDALDRAFEQGCDWLIHLNVEPRWALIRSEPRFQALLARVGLSA